MTRQVCLVAVCGVFSCSAALADEVVGAIWKLERQDKKEIKWQFRAGPKGLVWTTPKEGKPEVMGSWSGNPGKTVITIDKGDGKFGPKRAITIVQTGKNPLKWQGEVEMFEGKEKGKKFPLTITMVKD